MEIKKILLNDRGTFYDRICVNGSVLIDTIDNDCKIVNFNGYLFNTITLQKQEINFIQFKSLMNRRLIK